MAIIINVREGIEQSAVGSIMSSNLSAFLMMKHFTSFAIVNIAIICSTENNFRK